MVLETLQSDVITVLKKELDNPCNIWSYMGQVVLEISNDDFDKHMGCLVQHVIDAHFPDRDEDLCIVIRNIDKRIENSIKIWKPFDAK